MLESNNTEAIAFDIADLAARLERLGDTRDRRGKIYPLGMILTLVILAKLAGEDKPSGIAEWIRLRRDAFVSLFNCKHQRMPCLNIIRRVLQEIVSAQALEKEFTHYLHETYGGQQSQLVAIDGKTMRGTIPKGHSQGVHLLAAYLPLEGVVLKQVVVDAKENEVVGAPQLIEGLNLKDKVVCGDAMHTQRALSAISHRPDVPLTPALPLNCSHDRLLKKTLGGSGRLWHWPSDRCGRYRTGIRCADLPAIRRRS